MPLSMQVKLLRVLEEKVVERVGDNMPVPVNIRLISATNRDIEDMIVQNRFRDDLFYRINSISIRVPSLRERKEDIPFIAFHYMKKISYANNKEIQRISPPAMELLENYFWPGNVRQLISALEYAAVTAKGDSIEVSDLPDYLFQEKKSKGDKNVVDREAIEAALAQYKGNKTLAAKHLGMSRVTLWKKLKEFGLALSIMFFQSDGDRELNWFLPFLSNLLSI
jgi:DNA-binding NtrC family response regulator